ncbi:MAG: LLM class F420-dependent oxidoreductase [Pseudomonadales bacterium]|nr:LLM class F420-dependent oxidoreductase [Pseudomonadales bacterium]
MKLGLSIGYSGREIGMDMTRIKEAENLGFDSVWTAEAYGSDAVSPAAWILAQTTKIKVGTSIMQIPARTPANAAMTAMTLDALSGGRFIMGLGASGPQVVEGWHGVGYKRPVTRTKEYIAIIRKILEREGPVTFDGYHYQLPNRGEKSVGLGKPLKSILHGNPNIKIYTASITNAGIEASAEVANGVFPLWMNPERYDIFAPNIQKGFDKTTDKTLQNYDIIPSVTVIEGDDLEACREPIKQHMALYIGGMGAREKNFYNDYAKRLGYEDAAVKIQDLYLDGKKEEAAAAVPNQLVDDIALIGPRERIREQLQPWKEAGKKRHVDTMMIGTQSIETMRFLAEEML